MASRGSKSAKKLPTWQVDVGERVPGGGPRSGQDVDRLVGDVVAVAEVQFRQGGHVAYDEAQSRVRDVQAGQPQLLHVPQFASVIELTWDNRAHGVDRWTRFSWHAPVYNQDAVQSDSVPVVGTWPVVCRRWKQVPHLGVFQTLHPLDVQGS